MPILLYCLKKVNAVAVQFPQGVYIKG